MIFKREFKIGLKDIGKESKVTNKAILEYLENIAAYHSDSVGYGVNSIKETKVTWLLLDWKLQVIKRPKYGQALKIHTWSRYTNKCYSYRDFEIYDDNNNLAAIATSKWLLIDTEKGKISRIEENMIEKYKPETGKSVFNIVELDKLIEPENIENSISYEVRRRDIDINGHMHNLYYLDLAYEALPEKVYEQRPFENIQIMYKREAKKGDKLKINYTNKNGKNVVTIKSDDEKILHAIIELW